MITISITGLGRIGRAALRITLDTSEMDLRESAIHGIVDRNLG
jgi:glyceraldehyde-3-phosphate dehydrogenase/erythrose-4-phosphate dehydrogenase